MRVTGGEWRSRRLRSPSKGARIRPTPDAMRERMFSILGPRVAGARVLDLFAGTGAVGIEALSRGAEHAVFVDPHRAAAALIRSNLDVLGVGADRAVVLQRTAAQAIGILARRRQRFDLVWADPPFDRWIEGIEAVAASAATVGADDLLLLLECPADADVAASLPEGLEICRDVVGGASRVVMLRRNL